MSGTVSDRQTAYFDMSFAMDLAIGEPFVIDRTSEAPRAVGSGVTIRFGDRIALVPAEG